MWRQTMLIFALLWGTGWCTQDTELKFFQPFSMPPPLAGQVVHVTGTCVQQSKYAKREDAWQCFAKDIGWDPCFVKRFGSNKLALCTATPWTNSWIAITLESPVNNSHHEPLDMSRTLPWAIELTTGEKCRAVDSKESHDGLPVHYQCDDEKVLIGPVQRCKGTWTVLEYSPKGIDTVEIIKAWF